MANFGIAKYISEGSTLKISIQIDQQYGTDTLLHALAAFRVRMWQLVKAVADG